MCADDVEVLNRALSRFWSASYHGILPTGVNARTLFKAQWPKFSALMAYISKNGQLLKEVTLTPDGYEQAGLKSCFRCGDGYGLLGEAQQPSGSSDSLKRVGWLSKVEFPGKIVWNKFGDDYLGKQVLQTSNRDLLITTFNSNGTAIVRVDSEGAVTARHGVPVGAVLMTPLAPATPIWAGYMLLNARQTEFISLDEELKSTKRSLVPKTWVSRPGSRRPMAA